MQDSIFSLRRFECFFLESIGKSIRGIPKQDKPQDTKTTPMTDNIRASTTAELDAMRKIFECMPQIGWIAEADGTIQFFNREFYEYTGLIDGGGTGWDWRPLIHPDQLDEVMRRWTHSIQTATKLEMEFLVRNKHGEYRWFLTRATPVHNDAGEHMAWIGINTDIHEQKVAADIISERQHTLEMLAEAVPNIVWTAEPDGTASYFNHRWFEYTGQTTEEAYGYGWAEKLHPEDLDRTKTVWTDACSRCLPYIIEYRFLCRDGEYRWFLARALPVRNSRGDVVKWFGTCTDIHDAKVAETILESRVKRRTGQLEAANERLSALAEQLARSNRDLQEFAYVASHDLQEPLRTVISFCELLEKKVKDQLDADSLKYLDVIITSTERMRQLVRDLLTYARVSKDEVPTESVDLQLVLEEAMRNLQSVITESGATIKVTSGQLPLVIGDRTQLVQLFQNLISNSIKFKKPDARPIVKISAQRSIQVDGNFWEISVSDNGIGMNMEYADKIFVIFQRLHGPQQYSGTGIGLAICKRVVERHGGKIEVSSGIDKGSTFVFTLKQVS